MSTRFRRERRFLGVIWPFIHDFFREQSSRALVAVVLLSVAVGCQMIGFLLVYQIFTALSQQHMEQLTAGWALLAGVEVAVSIPLQTVVFVLFGVLVIGPVTAYLGGRKIIDAGSAYEKLCTQRIIVFWRRNEVRCEEDTRGSDLSAAAALLSSDVRRCGRAARILVTALQPMLLLLFLSGFLAYLNPIWTALSFISLLLAVLMMRQHFSTGSRAAFLLEATNKASRELKRDLLLDDDQAFADKLHLSRVVDSKFQIGPLANNFEAFQSRLVFQLRNVMLADLAGVLILALLLTYGISAVAQPQEVVNLVAFAVALRLLSANVRKVVSYLSALVKFFPSLERLCGDASFPARH